MAFIHNAVEFLLQNNNVNLVEKKRVQRIPYLNEERTAKTRFVALFSNESVFCCLRVYRFCKVNISLCTFVIIVVTTFVIFIFI